MPLPITQPEKLSVHPMKILPRLSHVKKNRLMLLANVALGDHVKHCPNLVYCVYAKALLK